MNISHWDHEHLKEGINAFGVNFNSWTHMTPHASILENDTTFLPIAYHANFYHNYIKVIKINLNWNPPSFANLSLLNVQEFKTFLKFMEIQWFDVLSCSPPLFFNYNVLSSLIKLDLIFKFSFHSGQKSF